jgi:hypothetical protein
VGSGWVKSSIAEVAVEGDEKAAIRLGGGPDIAVRLTSQRLVANGIGVVPELG